MPFYNLIRKELSVILFKFYFFNGVHKKVNLYKSIVHYRIYYTYCVILPSIIYRYTTLKI